MFKLLENYCLCAYVNEFDTINKLDVGKLKSLVNDTNTVKTV